MTQRLFLCSLSRPKVDNIALPPKARYVSHSAAGAALNFAENECLGHGQAVWVGGTVPPATVTSWTQFTVVHRNGIVVGVTEVVPARPIDPPTPDSIRAWHPELSYDLACAVRYELQDLIWRGKLRTEGEVIDAVPKILASWAKECVAATRNGPMWKDQSGASTDRLKDVSCDAPDERRVDRVRDAMLSWADELDAQGYGELLTSPAVAADIRARVELAERPDVTSGVGAVVGPNDGPTTIRQGIVSGVGTVGVEIG